MLGIWVTPNVNRKTEQLTAVLRAYRSTRSRQSYTFFTIFGLDLTGPLDKIVELGLRFIARKCFALRSFLHEAEGILLTTLIFCFRVDAEVKANVPAMCISHLPVAIQVSQLLEVKQALLRQLVTWV